MKNPKLVDRLRYQFDGFISRGTIALLIALIVVTSCVILSAAAFLILTGLRQTGSTQALTFAEAIWLATTRMLDPGTVAGDAGWWYRLVGFVVTLSGVFLSSALVGILVNGLYQRLDDLRQGRTPVIEKDHILILGWSPLVFTLLHELAAAHRSRKLKRLNVLARGKRQRNVCIVILTERDRLNVEEEIRLRGAEIPGARIVCRSGNPLDPDILPMVSPETARAIVVLPSAGEYPDLPVAQALLALSRDQKRKKRQYHVVAAVQNPSNLEIVRLVSDPQVQLFSSDRLLAFLTAHICRQPGLIHVYEALLRFEGTPIQFLDLSAFTGASYGDAIYRVEGAAAIGLQLVNGLPLLNPPLNTCIRPGDRLIVVGPAGLELDELGQTRLQVNSAAIQSKRPNPELPGRLLVLGWNRRGPIFLEALGQSEPINVEVTVLANLPLQQMQASCPDINNSNLLVKFKQGNPYDRPTLEAECRYGYAHVVILNPTEPPENQHAEVYTTVSWLYLQDIAQRTSQKFTILREMNDIHKWDMVSSISPSEALVRESLIGLVLAQVAQNKEIGPVLTKLISPEYARIVLRPALDYVQTREPVDFVTIMAAAQARQETAIGYQRIVEAGMGAPLNKLCLAPKWTDPVSFSEEDLLVLLVGDHAPQPEERIQRTQ